MSHRGVRAAFARLAARRRPWHACLVAVLAVTLVAPLACAQSAPRSILNLSTLNGFNQDAESRIADYAGYWTERLEAGSQVREATSALLEPLRNRSSRTFRAQYGGELLPVLERIALDPPSPYAGSNAAIIASRLCTQSAVDRLIDMTDPRRFESWTVRLAAARGVHSLFRTDEAVYGVELGDQVRIAAARRLADRVANEPDPRVVRYLLTAIVASDSDALLDRTKTEIHGHFARAITAAASKVSADPQMLLATGEAVAAARDRAVALASTRSGLEDEFSAAVGPALLALLEAFEAAWDSGEDDADRDRFAAELSRLEVAIGNVVRFIPGKTPARTSNLSEAWMTRDRTTFDAGVEAWRIALQ